MNMEVIVWDGKPITKPGIYRMPEEAYHADPCATPSLSASVCKIGLPGGKKGGSPLHMQWAHPRLCPVQEEEDRNQKFDLGSAFHHLMLGEGAELVVIDADSYRSKIAKEAHSAALKEGKQPILKEQLERARIMLQSARAQMPRWPELLTSMSSGKAELVLVWTEETDHGTIWCRCRLDWVPDNGDRFPDWKTTGGSAGPDDYGRIMFDNGAHIQEAFYQRGIKAVLDRRASLIFPAIETAKPHAMMVHAVHPATHGMAVRQVQWAMNTWALCLSRGVWPGYPGEVAVQSAPPWVENAWTDREDAGVTGQEFLLQLIESDAQINPSGALIDDEMAKDFGLI